MAALPPDRQYKYQIERVELELTVNKAMQKKFDLIMAERTVVCEAIALSNDETVETRPRAVVEDIFRRDHWGLHAAPAAAASPWTARLRLGQARLRFGHVR